MKPRNRLPAYGLAIFTSFGWQSYVQAAADSASDSLSEIVVTGVRQAMKDSIATKKNSDLIGDNITTAEIGQLPDVTIAEELNRLPGVNTTRDRGNASQASVRGLGPRLVLGLVNGREVASSEPSQDLRWEIYPSEVLSGAVVNKTQDAALIPGGIAATVDIQTVSPLDYKGPEFSFRAGPTYNDEGKDLPGYNPIGFPRQRRLHRAHQRRLRRVARGQRATREERLPRLSHLRLEYPGQLRAPATPRYRRPERRRGPGQHHLGSQHRNQGSDPGSLRARRRRRAGAPATA